MVWRLRFIQVVLLKVQGTYFIQTLGCFMLYRFQLVDTCLTPRLGTSDLYQTWLLLNKVRYLYFIHMYVLKVHLKSPQKQKSRMYWFQFWLLQRKRHRANMFLAIDPDINYLFHRDSIIFQDMSISLGKKMVGFPCTPYLHV